jgi:translation initiation factor 3 subunit A
MAAEAAKHEEEARIARMREERERQRAADLERIKLQQQREEEAARRAEERRRQPLAATATAAASQDGVWRRAGPPSAPPPPARTPPRSESPAPSGPPRPLFSRGGAPGPATSGWRRREQARSSSAEAGSPVPPSGVPEEPRNAEKKDDGFQAAKNVWKPSRLRG